MTEVKIHESKGFPWTSKSKLGDLDYCEYSFYKKRVLKEREQPREVSIEGTNLHMVFNSFYATISQQYYVILELQIARKMVLRAGLFALTI